MNIKDDRFYWVTLSQAVEIKGIVRSPSTPLRMKGSIAKQFSEQIAEIRPTK